MKNTTSVSLDGDIASRGWFGDVVVVVSNFIVKSRGQIGVGLIMLLRLLPSVSVSPVSPLHYSTVHLSDTTPRCFLICRPVTVTLIVVSHHGRSQRGEARLFDPKEIRNKVILKLRNKFERPHFEECVCLWWGGGIHYIPFSPLLCGRSTTCGEKKQKRRNLL